MNVTFQLDDELLRRAKLVAARRETSVSQLVREALEQQVAHDGLLERSGAQGGYETLVEYSLGEIPRSVAMERLALDDYGDLLGLLGVAGLPMPLVPAATRAEMVADMMATLAQAGVRLKPAGASRGARR